MKFSSPQTLKGVASLIKAEFVGDPNHPVFGMNEIHRVEAGDIVFVDHPKYYDKALASKATTILINKKVDCPEGKGLLISQDPFSDYNKLVSHFHPATYNIGGNISPSAKIGKNTKIFPGVYVGDRTIIGDNCIIYPNVTIYNDCVIGNNVIIHGNCVIGADAFYYKKRETHFEKLISCGKVIIEDEVELGALCTIDRGVSADTVIGKGSKFDNHVHVGHDTVIGPMNLFAAQVGVAGVVTTEEKVTLWGQAGISSDIVLGKGSTVMAQSGVGMNLEPGKSYFGSPAGEARQKMKELALIKRIPDILEKLRNLVP